MKGYNKAVDKSSSLEVENLIVLGITAVLLFVYLGYVLIRPEKF